MKPGPFTYHDPHSLSELQAVLGSVENAKVLAGGQSLMPMLAMRFVQPDHVIDINRISFQIVLIFVAEVVMALPAVRPALVAVGAAPFSIT